MRPAPAPDQSIPHPRPPPGTRIYAIGDIHGRRDLLDSLLSKIEADAAAHPASRMVVVFLGDYLDRGPQPRQVIDRLMAGPSGALAGAEWVCLRGNHEEYALGFLDDDMLGPAWLRNGGLSTLLSYLPALPEQMMLDMPALALAFGRALPSHHLRFLNRLPVSYRQGDYLFVHAGIRPGVAVQAQCPTDLLWIRDDFLKYTGPLDAMVVHGHTPTADADIQPNRIGIDTGAYYSGVLTALVLQDDQRQFLTT